VDTEKDHEFELDDTTRNKLKTTSREQYLHMLQQEQDRQRQMSIISFQPQTLFEKPQNKDSSHEREAYKKDSTHEPSASNEIGFNESDDQHLKQATEESAPLSKPQVASDPATSDPAGFAPQQKFQNYKFQIAEHEENSQQDSDARLLHVEGSIKNDNPDLDAIVRSARTAHSGSLQIGPTRNNFLTEEDKMNLNLDHDNVEPGSPQDRLGKHRPVQDAIKEEDEGQETGANALTQKDYLKLQIDSLWAQYDTDELGHLDNIEAANFVTQILKSHGHDAPSFEQLNKCFQEFQEEGNIEKTYMTNLVLKFVK
jgi:hypothetical protein